MNVAELEQFTDRLAATLHADPDVLGLILLGSTADPSYRDSRSDHDFWLIVTADALARYRDTVT